jgi:large subunit ribosomal protein L15
VTPEALIEVGAVGKSKKYTRIKILGDGDLTKKLRVSAHAFSNTAKSKIEAVGGTVTVIDATKTEDDPTSETAE